MNSQQVLAVVVQRFGTTPLRRLARSRRRAAACVAALAVGSFWLLGLESAGANATSAAGPTFFTAFGSVPSPLDPDTFYEAEGELILQSTYQSLLTFKPNSSTLVGLLATSWKESPNGLTYTFTLRKGVRFSDGTPFNSVAVKDSFERRAALKGGPSYMVADIKSMDTPSPYTFIVHMIHPQSPFLTYLASPFGPQMESPTAIKLHSVNGDHAAHWMATHTIGTNAYALTTVQPGVRYVLTRNPYYWGPKPYFATVNIAVIPDFATQELELESGQLTGVMHGLTTQAYTSLRSNPAVEVKTFPTLLDTVLDVNPASKVFRSATVRAALRDALSNKQITSEVFGQDAVPATNFYPNGMLPNGAVPEDTVYNPSLLVSALKPDKGMKVTVGWSVDVNDQLVANLVAAKLQEDGLNATVVDLPLSVVNETPSNPKVRPDLLIGDMNPDSTSPDTWARIYNIANGPVNWEGGSVPAADKLLNEAASAANPKTALRLGIEAATEYRNSNLFDPISTDDDTMVFRKGITGFHSLITYQYNIYLPDLKQQ